MDVLVYAGSETNSQSMNAALSTLRSLLIPLYSIQTISPEALKFQPWSPSCALLVFPQAQENFPSYLNPSVKEYVESGGALLGFGFKANYMSRSGHERSVTNGLQFQVGDKSTGLVISPNFLPDNYTPQTVVVSTSDGELIKGVHHNHTANFSGFEETKDVRILGKYDEGASIAGLICHCGRGTVALWAPSLEIPVEESLSDQRRLALLKSTLLSLNLKLPQRTEPAISHPLPQFLTSHPLKPTIVSKIANSIAAPSDGSQLTIFEDKCDTFHFHRLVESGNLVNEARGNPRFSDTSNWQPKHIILCQDALPDGRQTPLFDIELYYKSLSVAQEKEGSSEVAIPWGMGEALLYGEIVTSTQTLLEKNAHLLSRLPSPLVSLASHQLAGRGRGSNIWLSPSGSLSFSILLRVSLSSFPASKLVFVQYLFALAVVEACRDEGVLGSRGSFTRLKWPNDLYAVFGSDPSDRKKIGGILVNTGFSGGNVDIIIGCGLNVLNEAPAISLAQLLPPEERNAISLERIVTIIITKFEKMWTTFVKERGSFDSFMGLYLQRWLHSDQLITLTTVTPSKLVRITGITPDYGLLRTMPERTGWSTGDEDFIDLQPDGNSFDMMAGLIKSKSSR